MILFFIEKLCDAYDSNLCEGNMKKYKRATIIDRKMTRNKSPSGYACTRSVNYCCNRLSMKKKYSTDSMHYSQAQDGYREMTTRALIFYFKFIFQQWVKTYTKINDRLRISTSIILMILNDRILIMLNICFYLKIISLEKINHSWWYIKQRLCIK